MTRLKSHIWVSGYLRRLDTVFISAVLVRRGDADAGAIFIKLSYLNGTCQVLAPISTHLIDQTKNDTSITEDGRSWLRVFPQPGPEADAEAYLARQITQDSDIWIIEVESPSGDHRLGCHTGQHEP